MFDTTSTDAETLFDPHDASSQADGYRGRLPGRLSSSSLGITTEPIRSVNNLFPRPELTNTRAPGPSTH